MIKAPQVARPSDAIPMRSMKVLSPTEAGSYSCCNTLTAYALSMPNRGSNKTNCVMRYRCIFMDGEHSEIVTDIDAVDDADALLKSEVILADGDYASLEVWLEDRIVGYRLQPNRIAGDPHELWILLACLVGILAFFTLTMAVVLDAI